jgi:hypothetical protein
VGFVVKNLNHKEHEENLHKEHKEKQYFSLPF